MNKFDAEKHIKIVEKECDIEGELLFEVLDTFTGNTLGCIARHYDLDEYVFFSYDCADGRYFHSGTLMMIANKVAELNKDLEGN